MSGAQKTGEVYAHTPGPWVWERVGCFINAAGINDVPERRGVEVKGRHRTIRRVARLHDVTRVTESELEANGRLIAAAPALLTACERAEMWLSTLTDPDSAKIVALLRAAITQAKVSP